MRGIIAWCRRRFTCFLLSMYTPTCLCCIVELIWLCSIIPALAFSLDMFEKTNQSYGVNEVLLASVLGAIVFSLFAAQPLVIVGVTGEFGSRYVLWW